MWCCGRQRSCAPAVWRPLGPGNCGLAERGRIAGWVRGWPRWPLGRRDHDGSPAHDHYGSQDDHDGSPAHDYYDSPADHDDHGSSPAGPAADP